MYLLLDRLSLNSTDTSSMEKPRIASYRYKFRTGVTDILKSRDRCMFD